MRTLAFVALLAACAPTTAALRGPVDRAVRARVPGEPSAPITGEAIDALLAKPLALDGAIRIALATNPRLAAAFAELGIAGGEIATATIGGALGPTHVELALRWETGDHEYELGVVQDLVGLLELPRRRAAAEASVAAARARVTAMALRLIAQVEIAFRDVLVTTQEVELRRTAFDAADAAATLRERMHAAGTTTDLAQARERAAREQARVETA
ncbi:MAG: TolC family protein, partial [Proteobacteria bacterium]|nr:TolC family protein [Pseudomonadota bacterium]